MNPARSTGPAIALAFGGNGWALGQLWLFWVAPIVGGIIGALVYTLVTKEDVASATPVAD